MKKSEKFVRAHYPRAYVSYDKDYGYIIADESEEIFDTPLSEYCLEPEHAWNCAAHFMRLSVLEKFEYDNQTKN